MQPTVINLISSDTFIKPTTIGRENAFTLSVAIHYLPEFASIDCISPTIENKISLAFNFLLSAETFKILQYF